MKALLTTAFLTLSVFAANASVTIQASIGFGAAGKGCKGRGICRASTDTTAGMTVATLIYDSKMPGKLRIGIDEARLSGMPAAVLADMQAGRFVQEEQWILPADVATALSLAVPYNIAEGTAWTLSADVVNALNIANTYYVPRGTYKATIANGTVTVVVTMRRPLALR